MADGIPNITAADILRLGAGLVGSFVSMKFLKDTTRTEKALLVLGGAFLSLVGTGPAVTYFKLSNADGLVGFMLGLFGMAIVTKVYEAIQVMDVKSVTSSIFDRFFPPKKD